MLPFSSSEKQKQKRVEFGEGIVPKIIYEFCDSNYIDQNNYVDTIIRLQEIFYLYKNAYNRYQFFHFIFHQQLPPKLF